MQLSSSFLPQGQVLLSPGQQVVRKAEGETANKHSTSYTALSRIMLAGVQEPATDLARQHLLLNPLPLLVVLPSDRLQLQQILLQVCAQSRLGSMIHNHGANLTCSALFRPSAATSTGLPLSSGVYNSAHNLNHSQMCTNRAETCQQLKGAYPLDLGQQGSSTEHELGPCFLLPVAGVQDTLLKYYHEKGPLV